MALSARHNHDAKLIYDRKEEKDHAERGRLVGVKPKDGASILIVEDVAAVRDAIALILSDAGHRIQTAENGEQAEVWLRDPAQSFDVVVSLMIFTAPSYSIRFWRGFTTMP